MRFSQSIFAVATLVAAAAAQVAITAGPDFSAGVESGNTYVIEWTPADNTPTTLVLRKGDGDDLDTIATLTESATSGSFEWTVDTALPNGDDYALEIQQGSETNYWGPFPLTGSEASASSSAASSTGSASSSATASASSSGSSSMSITSAPSSAATGASASGTVSFSGNSTISSATLSRSVTGTGSSAAEPTGTAATTGAPVPTGAAAVMAASPMAFIFGAVAAMAYLN